MVKKISSWLLIFTLLFSVSANASVALVSSVKDASADSTGFTSISFNSTGANFIACSLASYQGQTTPPVTDSNGNTYSFLTDHEVSGDPRSTIVYTANPVVGAGHTITVTSVAISRYPSIVCGAFSGVTTVSPFDQQNGSNGSAIITLSTGSITPTQNSELILAALALNANSTSVTIGGGMTIVDTQAGDPVTHYGSSLAWLAQTAATAINPAWSWTGSGTAASSIASFKSPTCSGAMLLRGVGC